MGTALFRKVLFEKRRTIMVWAAILFVSNVMLALLFPAIRDTMGTMLGSVPPSMQNWIGSATTWQTYTGYAGQELFGEMATILVVMAIIFGATFLAGYEGNGVLLTELSRPVGRGRVYWQKYAAFVGALAFASLFYFAGAVVGGLILNEPIHYGVFIKCMSMVFLLALALGSLAYGVGAALGRSSLAGIIVGVYAFAAYLLASLSTAADVVDIVSHVSLFRYASATKVIAQGLSGTHIAILLGVTMSAALLGWVIFVRRDIKTR